MLAGGMLLHLVTKQNIPEEVGEWGLSIQRWLSRSRKSWCRQLRCGKLATRQSSILCSRIHQGKSRRAVDGKVRTPSERQLSYWSDCPSWDTFLRLIWDSIKKRFWEDCTATNTNVEGIFVMNGESKFKRVQSSRCQANHTSKLAKCTEKVSTTKWRLKKVYICKKNCSPTSWGHSQQRAWRRLVAPLISSQQGSSPMCLGLITFPLTYTPSALTSASPRSGDQDSWQDLDIIWILHDN